ncbi:MAG: carbamoyl-phosphate synthase large subunit, partial [Chloroflexi bacterium]|nr:carbamoyl-phosphate synthase large subunit [Chloroflexota bacterium]
MSIEKLLVANRGEIAIRIIRAARELGVDSVAIHSQDDANSLHVRLADEAVSLDGAGARAYLDVESVVRAAIGAGCDALHPGYGFLAESAELSRRCDEMGITFVGPTPESLELFGDKARARALAVELDVPVLPGTETAVELEGATEFFHSLGNGGAMMLKAIAGGGGRGMRVVTAEDQIAEAYERCQSEAATAFGNGDLLVERLMTT